MNNPNSELPPDIQPPLRSKYDLASWLERSQMFLEDARQYSSIATQTVGLAMSRYQNKIDIRAKFATTIAEDLAAAQVYATLSNTYMLGARYCLNRANYEETEFTTIGNEEIFSITPETSDFEGQS